MVRRYTVRYRQPGQWLWRKVKNVVADGIFADKECQIPLGYRFVLCDDDSMVCLSLDAEVRFPPGRVKKTEHDMSREAGIPVQRA